MSDVLQSWLTCREVAAGRTREENRLDMASVDKGTGEGDSGVVDHAWTVSRGGSERRVIL